MSEIVTTREDEHLYVGLVFFIVVFFYPGLILWVSAEQAAASLIGWESTVQTRVLGVVLPLFASIGLVSGTIGLRGLGKIVDSAWRQTVFIPRKMIGMKRANQIARSLILTLISAIIVSTGMQLNSDDLTLQRNKPKLYHSDFFITTEVEAVKENSFDLVVSLAPKNRQSVFMSYGLSGKNEYIDLKYKGLEFNEIYSIKGIILSDVDSLLAKASTVGKVSKNTFEEELGGLGLQMDRHGMFGIYHKGLFVGFVIPMISFLAMCVKVGFRGNVSGAKLNGSVIGFLIGMLGCLAPLI